MLKQVSQLCNRKDILPEICDSLQEEGRRLRKNFLCQHKYHRCPLSPQGTSFYPEQASWQPAKHLLELKRLNGILPHYLTIIIQKVWKLRANKRKKFKREHIATSSENSRKVSVSTKKIRKVILLELIQFQFINIPRGQELVGAIKVITVKLELASQPCHFFRVLP